MVSKYYCFEILLYKYKLELDLDQRNISIDKILLKCNQFLFL